MKPNGPVHNQKNATQTNAEIKEMINQLPADTLKEIFAQLDWASLATISQVNVLWHKLVYQLSQDLVRRYFPYLSHLPLFNENPLKLLVLESRSYQSDFPKIEMSLILAALSGNREVIATVKEQNARIVLYSLLSANNHNLPDDLSKEEKIQIHIDEYKQYARMGKLEDLRECLLNITNVMRGGKQCALTEDMLKMINDMIGEALKPASKNGHVEIVEYLLILIMGQDYQYIREALILAAVNGHHKVIELLLPRIKWGNKYFLDDVLGNAAGKGHAEVVKLLFSYQEYSSAVMGSALKAAASGGHHEVIKCFPLKKFIISDDDRKDALRYAARKGHLEVVKLLPLAEISSEYKFIILRETAQNGKLNVVKYLLPFTNITPFQKELIMISAAKNGHLDIVKFLLPEDDVLMSSWAKEDALCEAAREGHVEVVKYLMLQLKDFSDKEISLLDRKCPLLEAAKHGQFEVVKYLLMLNKISAKYKKVARQMAQDKGHVHIAMFIQDNIDAENNKKNIKNASKMDILKNFLNAPTRHPVKAAILLGLFVLSCSALFISLKSALMVSGLLSLHAYTVIRVRNYYIQQAQNRNISNADIDPVFVYREKNDKEKHAAYLNGYNAANDWIIYFKDFRNPNNWKYAKYYSLGMKIGHDQAEKAKAAKPSI